MRRKAPVATKKSSLTEGFCCSSLLCSHWRKVDNCNKKKPFKRDILSQEKGQRSFRRRSRASHSPCEAEQQILELSTAFFRPLTAWCFHVCLCNLSLKSFFWMTFPKTTGLMVQKSCTTSRGWQFLFLNIYKKLINIPGGFSRRMNQEQYDFSHRKFGGNCTLGLCCLFISDLDSLQKCLFISLWPLTIGK